MDYIHIINVIGIFGVCFWGPRLLSVVLHPSVDQLNWKYLLIFASSAAMIAI